MITFNEHIKEGKVLDPIKEELHHFLKREKIVGFDEDILSILYSEPTENVTSDIKDSFKDGENINVSKLEIETMDIKSMLEKYLEWNGLLGYSESIIRIAGMAKSEIFEGRELLVWRNKYYYYRPKKGSSTIWAWENPECEGIPKLIKVKEIYKTPTYYNKEYYKDVEKIYKKD